jgi:carboxyl-terminal processing protease
VSVGIKTTFNRADGSLTVTDVMPGSPAEGILQPFDRIMRIDSQGLRGRPLDEVDHMLEGEEGTAVSFTVNRDIQVFEVTLTRSRFETRPVVAAGLTERIAVVRIKGFTVNVSKSMSEALAKLESEGIEGVMIDMRNNTGGVLSEALRTAELFLPAKAVILRTLQKGTQVRNYVSGNRRPFPFALAVLVNDRTASAAELVAGALQDNERALVIGSQTQGKGVFEKTHTLKNEFRVKFITGAMYRPKGRSWQGVGITPDFVVKQPPGTLKALFKMEPEARFRQDVAMRTAYKLLVR